MGINCTFKRLRPDLPYAFDIQELFLVLDNFDTVFGLQKEMDEWCALNLQGSYYLTRQLAMFQVEEDAAVFKLKWL